MSTSLGAAFIPVARQSVQDPSCLNLNVKKKSKKNTLRYTLYGALNLSYYDVHVVRATLDNMT
jgi:hypothetical protein